MYYYFIVFDELHLSDILILKYNLCFGGFYRNQQRRVSVLALSFN